jgi:hypothetical protein
MAGAVLHYDGHGLLAKKSFGVEVTTGCKEYGTRSSAKIAELTL